MRLLTASRLIQFWKRHPDAKGPLRAFINEIEAARYENPAEVKAKHRSADFVGDKVVFNIGGNKYRLIARFRYARPSAVPPLNGIVRVLFIGTHGDYDDIDVGAL